MTPEQIKAARAEIAKQRIELDADEADLNAAERVAQRYGNIPAPVSHSVRKRGVGSISPQFANVLDAIDLRDGEIMRRDLRVAIDATRSTPITNNGFATVLSNMRKEHIDTEGDIVRRKKMSEGDADVS